MSDRDRVIGILRRAYVRLEGHWVPRTPGKDEEYLFTAIYKPWADLKENSLDTSYYRALECVEEQLRLMFPRAREGYHIIDFNDHLVESELQALDAIARAISSLEGEQKRAADV